MGITYESSGVNISAGNETVSRIKKPVAETFSSHVMGGIGGFGAMFDLKAALADYQHPVMVQSIDGVGTKAIVAKKAGFYKNLGHDLLSAAANDILVLGAKTLTMLDYIANDRLDPDVVETIVLSVCEACKANGVSLVGGEMAEMPDTYFPGEHDLVGVVTGVVDKDKIIDGRAVQVGDVVYGFASSGLHTNGFSLARKILFEVGGFDVDKHVLELGQTIGEALLMPHINYNNPVHAMIDAGCDIHGMAHITGGGLLENIPRVLPVGCAVDVELGSWKGLPIFDLMQQIGQVDQKEMFRTFNMGIGWVVIGPESLGEKAAAALADMPEFKLLPIGKVVAGEQVVSLV